MILQRVDAFPWGWCFWEVPPSVGLSHAWLTGLEETGAASQGSVRESAHGAQGLDALEDEGGAVQGLPITGVLEWTAVTRDRRKTQNSVGSFINSQNGCVCDEPPTYRVPGVRGDVSSGFGRVPRVSRLRWGLRWGAKYVHQVQHGRLQRETKPVILCQTFFVRIWTMQDS